MERPTLVSPSGRHSLILHGNLITLRQPNDDVAFVRLGLNVFTPPSSTSPAFVTMDAYEYPTVELLVTQMPDHLRELIHISISTSGLSAIGRDDHEAVEFLADMVTNYVNERMEGRYSTPRMLLVCASLYVGFLTPAQATLALASTLRKVKYRSNAEAAEMEMVKETSCPICLEDFEDGEDVHLTPCGHPFHLRCLESSLQRKAECPFCRTAMEYRRR